MGAPWQGLLGAVWRRGLGCIVHVQCTCKCFQRIIFSRPWGAHGMRHRSQTRRSHAYRTNLKSIGGATSVGCRLYAPGAENLFDEGSFGLRKFWARDTKLGTWVHLDTAYLAPYDRRGWGALCTCSARANVLHLFLFSRPYRSNGGHRWCQTCRSHVCYPSLYVFVVTGPVRCRLRAPGPEKFIWERSSGFRKLWAIDTKFGTLMELNERNSMVHAIWWWGE